MALTDILELRVVELGKIKIGGLGEDRQKKGGGTYRMPRKDDHFTVTTLGRDARKDLIVDKVLMDELLAKYGDADGFLRQIPIYVLSDDIEEVMQASYACYQGKSIAARSDGKVLTKYRDMKTGALLPEPVQVAWDKKLADLIDPKTGATYFKKHTTFNCVIASETARWGGVYKFRTTSSISGNQLLSTLTSISDLTRGVLRGLPMKLVVRPLQVNPTVNGNKVASTVYVIHCELMGSSLIAIQQQAAKMLEASYGQAATINRIRHEYKKITLDPGTGETVDEQGEIQEEFHPDTPVAPDMPPEGRMEIDQREEGLDHVLAEPPQETQVTDPAIGERIGTFATMMNPIETPEAWKALLAEYETMRPFFGDRWQELQELIDIKNSWFAEQQAKADEKKKRSSAKTPPATSGDTNF